MTQVISAKSCLNSMQIQGPIVSTKSFNFSQACNFLIISWKEILLSLTNEDENLSYLKHFFFLRQNLTV